MQAGRALLRWWDRKHHVWVCFATLGVAQASCYPAGLPPQPHATTVLLPEAGIEAGPASAGPTVTAQFGMLHAAEGQAALTWSLTSNGATESGSLDYAKAAHREALAPGIWSLDIGIGADHLSQDVAIAPGSEVNAVVTADPGHGLGWQVDLLVVNASDGAGDASDGSDAADAADASSPTSSDTTEARLFVLQRSKLGAIDVDVGNDDPSHPDGHLAAAANSPIWLLDVTRPALAFLNQGQTSYDFTLPRPAQDSTVIAVALGDPALDGLGASGLRLLVARMVTDPDVTEVRPDPTLYFVHASGAHAGLDLFIGSGNPLDATFAMAAAQPGLPAISVPAFVPDISLDVPLNMAQVADDARFGELRVGRVPPGPATLDIYLTIPADPQLPSPLNYDLDGVNLLPNQRLRNGGAVGRQSAQTVGGALLAGAEYLLVAPGGLWNDNRDKRAPVAPGFSLTRLQRSTLPADQFQLSVAFTVTKDGTTIVPAGKIGLDGTQLLSNDQGTPFSPSSAQLVAAGTHSLSLQVGAAAPMRATLSARAGQDLLVIAAGDASPPPTVVLPTPWRADDLDGDGAVCSSYDAKTQTFADPNYLPPDGDSTLVQDDCPNEPGPQRGCPSPALQWLVIDLSARPPTIESLAPN